MTKRFISLLLLALMLLMAFPASAASTKEEWDASCNWVIARDTSLYSASFRDDITTGTDLYRFTAFGSISAGERVSIRSSAEGMREIYYWDGVKRSAWVEETAVRWAGGASTSGAAGEAGEEGGTPASNHQPLKLTDAWKDLAVTLVQGEGDPISVTLQELGTAQCVVYDGEALLTIPTSDLYWETEAPEEQRLAVIDAPKTGKATLRAKASSSARSLEQCQAGRIVVVLKVGSSFTRVLYDGKEGFVLTAALSFLGAAPEDGFSAATLSYKGRTDSSATISIYTEKGASRKIKQWRVGNEVIVLSQSGSWSEVEIDGWHGWCKSAYLQ